MKWHSVAETLVIMITKGESIIYNMCSKKYSQSPTYDVLHLCRMPPGLNILGQAR